MATPSPLDEQELRMIAELSASPSPRPIHSDNLVHFACVHCPDLCTSHVHIATSYRRMITLLSRRRFDVYCRKSVSPITSDGRTYAQLVFDAWYGSCGLDTAIDDSVKKRLSEWRSEKKRMVRDRKRQRLDKDWTKTEQD